MKIRFSALLFLLGCILIIILAARIAYSLPVTISAQVGNATVILWSDRDVVFAPHDCVGVTWNIEGVREVYFNGSPTTGNNGVVYCLTSDTLPRLRIVFEDRSEQFYTLPILILTERADFWALVLMTGAIWIIAVVAAISERQPKRIAAPDAPSAPVSKRLTLPALIGWGVMIAAAVYVSGELLLRGYFGLLGTENQRISFVYSREQINIHNPSSIVLPIVGFGLSPYAADVNTLGYRGEEITLPKPDGEFRIVALGGSTTYGYTPVDQSYPEQLETILQNEYEYPQVEVINAGVPGYTTFNTVPNFLTRVLELEPDMVIFYEGVNDILTREIDPDCYRGNNALRGLTPGGLAATDMSTSALSPSVLYRFVSIRLGWEHDPLTLQSLFRSAAISCGGTDPHTMAENVASNPPIYFQRNLRTLIAVAHMNHVDVMFSTWAYNELSDEALAYWRAAIAEHNQIITELAAEYALYYLDYAPLAPQEDSAWADYVHMNVEGSHHQAETYAAFIAESGVIPPPG